MLPHHHRADVRSELLASGWLRTLKWFSEVDSTNSEARRALDAGSLSLPALLIADRQTAGRGRSDHPWFSPNGCLMLTLVITHEMLDVSTRDVGQLALVCGVAVADTVAQFVTHRETVQLKWPNDVYVGGKKVAGILIESATDASTETPGLRWLIGIGLNVNIDWEQAPPLLRQRATAIGKHAEHPLEPEVVLVELVGHLQRWLAESLAQPLRWHDRWHDRCLLSGQIVSVRTAVDQVLIGRCEGVDTRGRLLIRDASTVHCLHAGEVIDWQ